MKEQLELFKKSSFMFITNGFGKGLLLISEILLVRLFGTMIYGENAFLLNVITLIAIIPVFGFQTSLVAFIPKFRMNKNEKEIKELITFVLLFGFIVSLLLSIVLSFKADYIAEHILNDINLSGGLSHYSFLLIIIAAAQIMAAVFLAERNVKIFSLINNGVMPLAFIASVLMLYFTGILENGTPIIAAARYLSYTLPVIMLFVLLLKKKKLGRINGIKKHVSFLAFSSKVFMNSSLNVLKNKMSIFLVGYYLGMQSVAVFNISSQFALLISFMLTAINQVFNPIISKLYHEGRVDEIQKLYGKTTRILAVVSILFMIVIIIFKDYLMLIFGKEFVVYSNIIIILALGQMVHAMSGTCGGILTMMGNPEYNLYINMGMLSLNIILGVILIPQFGIYAAAFVSAGVIIVSNLIKVYIIFVKYGMLPFFCNRIGRDKLWRNM